MRKTRNRKIRNRKTKNRKTRNRIIGGADSTPPTLKRSINTLANNIFGSRPSWKPRTNALSNNAQKAVYNARHRENKQASETATNNANRQLKKTQLDRQINDGWKRTFQDLNGLYTYLIDRQINTIPRVFQQPPIDLLVSDEEITQILTCAYFGMPTTKISDQILQKNMGTLKTIFQPSIHYSSEELKHRENGKIQKDILKLLVLNAFKIGTATYTKRTTPNDVDVPLSVALEYDRIRQFYKDLSHPEL